MANEYFSELNYTLANEDTAVEFGLLQEGTEDVFCISGSGARVFPLLGKNPKRLTVVDLSPSQLYLAELRIEAARCLNYEEWLFFLGYRGGLQGSGSEQGDRRGDLFRKIKLSPEARQYWQDREPGWSPRGFIFLGKWERHFQMLGGLFRNYLKCDFDPIFQAQSLPEQIDLWKEHWPVWRFNTFMRIAASETVFNRFLYKGHFAGADGNRTETRAPSVFLREEFQRIFTTQLVRKSFFMQVLFLGGIRYEEGLPFEAHQHVFEKAKQASTDVFYQAGNLVELLKEKPWGFVSLSDTVSYLPLDVSNRLLQQWPQQTPSGSMVVMRSFMKGPTDLSHPDWAACPQLEAAAWKSESTGVYRFHIMKKK